jgi:hypothetical protein
MISTEYADRFLASRKFRLALDPPQRLILPIYRRMRFWQHADDPRREIGVIVIDDWIADASWHAVLKLFEPGGEFYEPLDNHR